VMPNSERFRITDKRSIHERIGVLQIATLSLAKAGEHWFLDGYCTDV